MSLQTNRQAYLLNIPFILGLALLLLNDHYLKGAFGNWYTGKLSDFAGVFILPFFLQFLLHRKQLLLSIIATVVFFTVWKSPLADPLINFCNSVVAFPIARVVDYTDLMAFALLPLSYYVMTNIEHFSLSLPSRHSWATPVLFVISISSFVATSKEDDFVVGDGSPISACCEILPTLEAFGDGNIYIPNIFTPDGDGINDVFQVVANPGIAQIESFQVITKLGGTSVFFAENITNIDASTGWDGTFNDTIVPDSYLYTIKLTTTDNISETFTGYVCCIPCNQPTGMGRPVNLDACGFATQYDPATGEYDLTAPSQEALDCFE